MNDVVRTKDVDRAYKECFCCVCETISTCTPSNDFYDTDYHGDGIICQSCFYHYCNSKVSGKPTAMTPKTG